MIFSLDRIHNLGLVALNAHFPFSLYYIAHILADITETPVQQTNDQLFEMLSAGNFIVDSPK